ncbi:hypothetical protein FHW79_005401 [Azospirillum sp. OGB3]|uniref:Uncharacterized protein n=2 Tax=Azospirillum argentinense TaxID=2970906 RepID=A0A5B0KNB6_9PROT|nr:hypothetical protein [Azospirillum sp. OGB3]KAA1053759.1 hypothetical protein FH063_002341 [Azospirillum argentinense]MBB3267736.1 hypothetical protein [Azospirillum sp. OGB3]
MNRSSRPEVRNPILALPATARLLDLPPEVRLILAQVLRDLYQDAKVRADKSWASKKGPLAVYWKAVAVYALHISRAVRPTRAELRSRVVDLKVAA